MTTPNMLGELLADPEVIAQVTPLLHEAVDARIAPLAAQIERLSRGVELIAQATVEGAAQAQAQAQAPAPPPQGQGPATPPSWPGPAPIGSEQYQAPPPPNGLAPQPYQPPAPAPTAAVDKLAQFAPLLMQYLTKSNQQQSTNLSGIAETLSAAAQISNVMTQPMWQGMKMATDMMSMSGRAGMDPIVAANTLGGMIDNQKATGAGAAETG